MKIPMQPFILDPSVHLAAKCISGNNPQLLISFDDGVKKALCCGEIVLGILNRVNPIKHDSDDKDVAEYMSSKYVAKFCYTDPHIWDAPYNEMTSFLLNVKDRSLDQRVAFYNRYRYFAYYMFSGLRFEDNTPPTEGIAPNSKIIKYKIDKNELFQIIMIYGWGGLFDFDLSELLFNPKAKLKIKRCKSCKDFFSTSKKNRNYCEECQPKVYENYSEEYRELPENKRKKSILAKIDTSKKYNNYNGDDMKKYFLISFNYYYDIVIHGKSDREKPINCNENIKTYADFIKWLDDVEDEVRTYKKGDPKHGKTDEASKRHGSDNQSVGKTQKTVSSDDNSGMER